MSIITRTRRRDKATTYHVKYRVRELAGREVTEMVGSVPDGAGQRAHDRMRNKADSLFHQRHIEMDNGTWVHPKDARPKPSLTLGKLVEKFLKDYESRSL